MEIERLSKELVCVRLAAEMDLSGELLELDGKLLEVDSSGELLARYWKSLVVDLSGELSESYYSKQAETEKEYRVHPVDVKKNRKK